MRLAKSLIAGLIFSATALPALALAAPDPAKLRDAALTDTLAYEIVEGLTTDSVSPSRMAWRRYWHHRAAAVSTIVMLFLVIVVLFAPYTARYGFNEIPHVPKLLRKCREKGLEIDPSNVTVSVEPPTVGWREPIRVRLRSEARITIPFLLTTSLPLSSSAVARGELAR